MKGEQAMKAMECFKDYSPGSLTARPWKMVGKEDDPFLLGPKVTFQVRFVGFQVYVKGKDDFLRGSFPLYRHHQKQVSYENKPWVFRVFRGWWTTHLYRDYNKPL